YRNAARSVWNSAFWSQRDLRTWDSWEQFEAIKKILFQALVISRLGTDAKTFRVVPNSFRIPIMIRKPREGEQRHTNYWDDPVKEIKSGEAELHFVDYFDWNPIDHNDFQYYRVGIAAFPSQPHLVGREALVQHLHGKVFVS